MVIDHDAHFLKISRKAFPVQRLSRGSQFFFENLKLSISLALFSFSKMLLFISWRKLMSLRWFIYSSKITIIVKMSYVKCVTCWCNKKQNKNNNRKGGNELSLVAWQVEKLAGSVAFFHSLNSTSCFAHSHLPRAWLTLHSTISFSFLHAFFLN